MMRLNIAQEGQIFELDFQSSSDTVGTIKKKIKALKGIPVSRQILSIIHHLSDVNRVEQLSDDSYLTPPPPPHILTLCLNIEGCITISVKTRKKSLIYLPKFFLIPHASGWKNIFN